VNLAEIKSLVVNAAGGLDMDQATLRAFINAGQGFLDRLSDFPHGQAKMSFEVAQGQYFLVFPTRVRMIHNVWRRLTLTEQGTRLEKKDQIELFGLYPNLPQSSGPPAYYANSISVLGSLGSPSVGDLNMPIDNVPVSTDDPNDYRGMFIGPAPDQTYYIDVFVSAASIEMVADTDMSFWSKHFPLTLMYATLYKIEMFLRNAGSAKDYLEHITNDVRGINFDGFEDELQDKPNYMGT
jgi:hypothetical protein